MDVKQDDVKVSAEEAIQTAVNDLREAARGYLYGQPGIDWDRLYCYQVVACGSEDGIEGFRATVAGADFEAIDLKYYLQDRLSEMGYRVEIDLHWDS